MRNIKIAGVLIMVMLLHASNAHATEHSQILVMSNQLFDIAKDLTTGMFPTAIMLIAIGLWGAVHAFGKNIGDGVHQLTNIIAVGGVVFFATSLLINASLFSAVV